jgi:hypothetical protein
MSSTNSAASQDLAPSRLGLYVQQVNSARSIADAQGLSPLERLVVNLLDGPSLSEEWRAWVEETGLKDEGYERVMSTDQKGLQRGERTFAAQVNKS